MNNDDAYAGGLLARALNPSSQPPAIRAFLSEECEVVQRLLGRNSRVVDFGCGGGRHLVQLREHVARGVGFDYEMPSIAEAVGLSASHSNLDFFVADATRVPLTGPFDHAVCLTNTWGTIPEKALVLDEMRRLSPTTGSRLVTVYSATSVPARTEWYANMGHPVLEVTETQILAEGGFTSEHFTESRVREHIGPCTIHALGAIAYVVQF